MNLNQLRVFHSAATLLNFTRAAEELHLTQPGISKHLKMLEEYYGTKLFYRLGKKLVLTQAGEALFEATSAAFHLINSAKTRIDDLNGLESGKLIIGASVTIATYILPKMLVHFRQRYPGIAINVDTALSRQIADRVIGNSLELGLVGHCVSDARLSVKQFMTDRLVLIVSPEHPWAERKTAVHLSELESQTMLLSNRGSGTWRTLEAYMAQKGAKFGGTIELGSSEGIKRAIEANLGVSMLSRHLLDHELASGVIKSVPLVDGEPSRDLYLIHYKDRYLSHAARAFMKLLE